MSTKKIEGWIDGLSGNSSSEYALGNGAGYCDDIVTRIDKHMGFSGAQVGAAIQLAAHLYRKGPRACMEDEAVKDRHIQVSKAMPSLPVGW